MARRDPEDEALARMSGRFHLEVTWEMDTELGIPVPFDSAGTSYCQWGGPVKVCTRHAGWGTEHPGIGPCRSHDRGYEHKVGVWQVAHLIAQVLDISPWEALLLAVRRAATWANFYESQLARVENDDDLRPGGTAHDWVVAAERTNDKMARYAKMAVDAGVAAMLVQQARSEGEQIARVLNAALGVLDLSETQETAVRAALRTALLELEDEGGTSVRAS